MKKAINFGFGITLAIFAVSVLLVSAASATTVSIGSGSAANGETDVVSVMISDVTDLGGVGINLTFDQSVVDVTALANSDFDSSPDLNTRGPGWVILEGGQYEHNLSGDVKLCDVTLEAVGEPVETSYLNLTDVVLEDMGMQPITVDEVFNGTFTVTGIAVPKVVINEFLPDPASDWNGNGTIEIYDDEFIELYNYGSDPVDISGWELKDVVTPHTYTIPDGTTIGGGEWLVFFGNTTGIVLNNDGDTVLLLNDTGVGIDSRAYTSNPGDDISIGRLPDGDAWNENLVPTPGAANEAPAVEDTTAPTTEVTIPPDVTAIPSGTELPWTNEDVNISFRRTDNGGGNISGVNYTNLSTTGTGPWTMIYYNGTINDLGNIGEGNISINLTTPIPYNFTINVTAEGEHTIWYYSVDNESNVEPAKNLTVRIDRVAPGTVTGLNETANGTYWIQWNWTNPDDLLSGFDHVEVWIDNEFEITTTENGYKAIGFMSETTHIISVRAVDVAGNIGDWANDTATTQSFGPQPFLIYGFVFSEDSTACNGPSVNITNLNNNKQWTADTIATSNYYGYMLTAGVDVNVTEVLRFDAKSPDETQTNTTEYTVTDDDITNGGLFEFNITLVSAAPAYDVELIAPANQTTIVNVNATYGIVVNNTGSVTDTFNLSVDNLEYAAVANLSTEQVTLDAGANTTVLLNVTDETAGTYNVSVYAESVNESAANDTVTIMTTVITAPAYDVELIAPANQTTIVNVNATYGIVVNNTGSVTDTFNLSVDNLEYAAVANLSTEQVTLDAGANTTVLLNVTDETAGTYNVSVTATSDTDPNANDTITVMTTVLPINITAFTVDATVERGHTLNAIVTVKNEGSSTLNNVTIVVSGVEIFGYPLVGTGVIGGLDAAQETTLRMLVYVPPSADLGDYSLFADAWLYEDYPIETKAIYRGPEVTSVTS